MLILIYGGSGSGKSEYAEQLLLGSKDINKYYLATMKVFSDEDIVRVNRHKKLREGKNFSALEIPTDVDSALETINKENTGVLLECMSNLVANEMFKDDTFISADIAYKKIISEVETLNKNINNLFIVTNNIFDDGLTYDDMTKSYIYALSKVNEYLASLSDSIFEVVAGIPIRIK